MTETEKARNDLKKIFDFHHMQYTDRKAWRRAVIEHILIWSGKKAVSGGDEKSKKKGAA